MDKKKKKPTIIELTEEDRRFLEYKRNLMMLKELSRQRGKLHKIIPLLQHVKPDLTPKEYIDLLEKRQAQLRKNVSEYKKHKANKIDRYQRIKKTDYNKVRLCDRISRASSRTLYLIAPAQTQPSTNRIILGQSGNCQIIHELIETPSDFHKYKEEGPFQNDSRGGADTTEVFHPAENSIECELELTDETHIYSVDPPDLVYATGLHQYNIPAPACDSLISVWVNFWVGVKDIEHDAEWGYMQVYPILYVSPTGSTPSYADLFDPEFHLWDYGVKVRVEDGETEGLEYTGFDFSFSDDGYAEYKTHYYVNANVTSKIYFGIAADLWAREGTFEATACAYLTYPPGAMPLTEPPLIPGSQPPFPPIPGVQYISWAESMFPECYITTAICSVLGKSDNCYELQLLRNFRDSYVKSLPDGDKLIAAYYEKAPYIARFIESKRKEKEHVLLTLYDNFLRSCIDDIEKGHKDRALSTYKRMVSYVESLVEL